MKSKNLIVAALLVAACTSASLASCGKNNADGGNSAGTGSNGMNGERVTTAAPDKENKETEGNIIDKIESGAESIGSDIRDSINNPEDATHGTENMPAESGENSANDTQITRDGHRKAVPYGK